MSEKTPELVGLAAKNFKGLKEIEVSLKKKGMLIVFGGDESTGKSTAMEILTVTLYGKGRCPRQPIRKGEKDAWTETRFEGLIARRVFTAKGTRLEVKADGDMKASSPQSFLEKLFGGETGGVLPVDPLAFLSLSPKEQVDTLRRMLGLDFSALDAERQEVYDKRHGVNAEARNLEERLASIPQHEDVQDKPVVIAQLLEMRRERADINERNRKEREELAAFRGSVTEAKTQITHQKEKITELEADLVDMRSRLEEQEKDYTAAVEKGKQLAKKVEALADANIEEIDSQIGAAEETNTKVRQNEERATLVKDLEKRTKAAQALTTRIDEIDAEKAELVAQAEFPVEGLAFDDERVTFNEVDINQASQNEKVRATVGMILTLNPKAPAIVIDEGSGLSEKSLAVLAELAETHNKYIFVGRTSTGSEVTFLMKDGEVVDSKEDEDDG